jgi:DNA-binding NtrC family response regulator
MPDHSSSQNALIIEPAPAMSRILQHMVQSMGFAVTHAESSDQALAIAERSGDSIALLVTEFALPGISGQAIGSFIAERNSEVALVYLCDEACTAAVLLRGRSAALQKPFSREELERAIFPQLGWFPRPAWIHCRIGRAPNPSSSRRGST